MAGQPPMNSDTSTQHSAAMRAVALAKQSARKKGIERPAPAAYPFGRRPCAASVRSIVRVIKDPEFSPQGV